ncbi:hypothetical protein NHH73_14795 [Oxalobacteraceae bacterium OTU3CINTB1]|nr:hypothetical protein NHH73_14795 [Oxalobacteraceae bacterium OTU3CINTB1]
MSVSVDIFIVLAASGWNSTGGHARYRGENNVSNDLLRGFDSQTSIAMPHGALGAASRRRLGKGPSACQFIRDCEVQGRYFHNYNSYIFCIGTYLS